jgi:hypothetical protein
VPDTVRVRTNSAATRAALLRIQAAFQQKMDKEVLARVAWEAHSRLVLATPKGWTGNTRQRWRVVQVSGRGYRVTNGHKVMLWLEFGTKAHGPKTAKALFIPLTRSAALGGYKPGMKFGKDFILRKRVKGIKAMHIVRKERARVKDRLREEMVAFIRRVVASP